MHGTSVFWDRINKVFSIFNQHDMLIWCSHIECGGSLTEFLYCCYGRIILVYVEYTFISSMNLECKEVFLLLLDDMDMSTEHWPNTLNLEP